MTKARVANIAYVLFPSDWGQGYASEAVTEMLDFLAFAKGVTSFIADVDSRNVRSVRLLERLGFTVSKGDRVGTESATERRYVLRLEAS